MIRFQYITNEETVDAVFFQTGLIADEKGRIFRGIDELQSSSINIRIFGCPFRGMMDVIIELMRMCPVNVDPGAKQYPRMFIDDGDGFDHFVFLTSEGHGIAFTDGDPDKVIRLYDEWDTVKIMALYGMWDDYKRGVLVHCKDEAKKVS